MKALTGRGRGNRRLLLAVTLVLVAAGASAQSGMGIYGGLNLGFGQFGADISQRIPNWDSTYTTLSHKTRFNAFALTPVVGITPFRGHSSSLVDKLAFEFQLAMKWGKFDYTWGAISGSEIRPSILAKFNFSIADWAGLFGASGPTWGDRLVTFGGVGFGIPIRTAKLSYSTAYKESYENYGVELSNSKTTKGGFQILMEYGLGFQINDKFSLNWTMVGLGFIGHFTYDMTLGANYHFR